MKLNAYKKYPNILRAFFRIAHRENADQKYILAALMCGVVIGCGYIGYSQWAKAHAYVPKHYNVVLISIDSLRADHLGVYGQQLPLTPHLDAFAKESVVFNSYFSTTVMTPTSEMSVHTGLYPFSSGVVNYETNIATGTEMLAMILKENGYRTGAFGNSPEFGVSQTVAASFRQGFDVYAMGTQSLYAKSKADGHVVLRASSSPQEIEPLGQTTSSDHQTLLERRWNRSGYLDAEQWMKSVSASSTPFFAWITVGSAHLPYRSDGPYTDPAYNGIMRVPESEFRPDVVVDERYGHYYRNKIYGDHKNVVSEDASEDLKFVQGAYDNSVLATDASLEELLAYLSSPEIARSTIVIIQSEHGEELGEHGYIGHMDIFDPQMHVPLLIRAPNMPGRHITSVVSGVDVFPTALDMLGISYGNVDGVSFLPIMTNATTTIPRSEVFFTRTPLWQRIASHISADFRKLVEEDNTKHFHDTAIRTDSWLLIHRLARAVNMHTIITRITGVVEDTPEYELYDVKADPDETHNMYAEDNPVAQQLRELLNAWEETQKPAAEQKDPVIQPYF